MTSSGRNGQGEKGGGKKCIFYYYVIMEQQNVYKLGKEYVKAIYCHLAYLTYMQSTSCEMPGWMKHSWNQDWWEKY